MGVPMKRSVLQSLTAAEFDALPELSPEDVAAVIASGRESRLAAQAATPRPVVALRARITKA